jgi:hypothetical protein
MAGEVTNYALGEQEKGIVVTTDHHEFDAINNAGVLPFYWLKEIQ